MLRSICFLLLMLLAFQSRAHDTWLMPIAGAEPETEAWLQLSTGDGFPSLGQSSAIERLANAVLVGEKRTRELYALPPSATALPLWAKLGDEDLLVAMATLKPKEIVLEAEKAAQYLREELGDDAAIQARHKKLGTWRERFNKHAKTILRTRVGDGNALALKVFGLPYELVPERDPSSVKVGTRFKVCAYRNGARVKRAFIGVVQADGSHHAQWSDQKGCVRIRAENENGYMLHSVFIEALNEPNLDWESHFASLTVYQLSPRTTSSKGAINAK